MTANVSIRYIGVVPQYGTMEPMGKVDFYPGKNGYYGYDQPGCLDIINIVSCSHSRARELYGASIKDAVCLASGHCQGDPHKIPKNCANMTGQNVVAMGYWWDWHGADPGLFIVEESMWYPYCVKPSII